MRQKLTLPPMRLMLVLMLALASAEEVVRESCSSEQTAVLQEDAKIFLGGLFEFRNPGGVNYGCGAPAVGGMQEYEAIRWALSLLNRNQGTLNGRAVTDSYIPGVQLGMLVRDTCGRSELAIDSAVQFLPELKGSSQSCQKNTTIAFMGIVSGSNTQVTAELNQVLARYKLPSVSFTATGPTLGDPYFVRTVPSAVAQVTLATLSSLGWKHVSVVYADTPEGNSAVDSLLPGAANLGICIAQAIAMPINSTGSDYLDTMRRLVDAEPSAVVYMGDERAVSGLLDAANGVSNAGRLQWLFSESVGINTKLVADKRFARGAVTIAPAGRYIPEFEDHWVRLNGNNRPPSNPWYLHWFMTANKCRLSGVNYAPYNIYNLCPSLSERQRRAAYQQSPYTEPAILSVYAFARAIRTARSDLCRAQSRGLCPAFLRMTSEEFYNKYLKLVDITFGQDERIPSLASVVSEPYRAARQMRFNMAGDIMDPEYAVYNYNDRRGTYQFIKVGTFSRGDLTLNRNMLRFYDASRRNPLAQVPESKCPTIGCTTCLTKGTRALRPVQILGDVLIGGFFSLHQPGATSVTCGAINTRDGAELLEAFLYAIKNAQRLQFWRGPVNLGAIAFDDCSSSQLASNTLVQFLNGEETGAVKIDASKVHGYVAGNNDAITMAVASMLGRIPLPQVSYKVAPAALSDQFAFPSFAELLPASADGINAIAQMLTRLKVPYMHIIHDTSEASLDLLKDFQELTIPQNICVAGIGLSNPRDFQTTLNRIYGTQNAKVLYLNGDFAHFEQFLSGLNRSANAAEYLIIPSPMLNGKATFANKNYRFRTLTLVNKSPTIQGWEEYLSALTPDKSTSNPVIKEWYQQAFNCYLDPANQQGYPSRCKNPSTTPITSSPGYRKNVYSTYVIAAVGALARSINKALEQYCGIGYTSVCAQYVNAADRTSTIVKFLRDDPYVKGDTIKGFDVAYMRPGTPVFAKIGDVQFESSNTGRKAKLSLGSGAVASIGEVSSICGSFCQDCLYMYDNQVSMHIPGEILIGGLFNVHYKGTGYGCGDLRPVDGFQYTEAFRYAIKTVNDGTAPVSLRGIPLGGLAMDSCSNKMRGSNIAASIYSGSLIPRDDEGTPIDVSRIKGWLVYMSEISKATASVLGNLGITTLSPSSTSIALSDKEAYPTFYRTVPSNDKQSAAIASLIDYFKWQYVQTINSPDNYGRTGISTFSDVLKKSSTCSVASYEFKTDGNADELIASLLASSTSVVVLFGGQNMTKQLLDAKARAGRVADKLVFVTSERVADMPSAANVLSFGVDMPSLPAFNSYLSSIVAGSEMGNPWFNEVYQNLYKCDLPGSSTYGAKCEDIPNRPITNSPGFRQDPRILTTVNAVYALVKAIDLALIERCGTGYSSVCLEFMWQQDGMQLITSKLDQVMFRDPSGENVKFVDRQHNRGYALYKYSSSGDSIRIGGYKDGILGITDAALGDAYQEVSSTCPGSCLQCMYDQQQGLQFTASPGDVYFAGLFDVHSAGTSALLCGPINTQQGWQLVEAFNFAIARVNNKTGIFHNQLPGVRVGAIGLDTCSSPSRASNLVANIQSGLLPLMMGNTRIPPDRIDVYVGAYDSDTSAAVASFLKLLGIPQLSYGATSTGLRDTEKYPNFLRTVPADDKLARAVVALLKNYNIEYVQVVNSPGTYGDDAAKEFTALAAKSGICVGQVVRLAAPGGRLTDGGAEKAVWELLNKPAASVVVTFIDTDSVNRFLRAVNRVLKEPRFHFVGSETWSSRVDILDGIGDIAKDALTLGVETADLSTFDRYLRAKKRSTYRDNPWFDQYYEAVFDCSLTRGSSSNARQCPPDRDVVLAPGYTQDQYVLYTVNAVYSAAIGLHYALKQTCGENYFGVCEEFRNAPNRHQLILEGMRKATFLDATNQRFDFSDNGESNRGYHIYTARKTPGSPTYYYENVGSYNDTDLLKIRPQQQFSVSWNSDCSTPGSCEECTTMGHQPTRAMDRSQTNLNLVGFFDVHYADQNEPLRCGPLNKDYGFQNMLAFFYAIDRFNRNNNFRLQIGGLAVDTCSSDVRVSRDLFSLLMGQGLCEADGIGSKMDPSSIIAVIPHGESSSRIVPSMLAPRKVTMVSPTSGDDKLSGSPYFLSTIPPNAKRAEAMAAVARALGWHYMAAVNSENPTYEASMRAYFTAASTGSDGNVVCMSQRLTLPEGATAEDARALIKKLNRIQGSNTVVLFTTPEHTRLLLEAVRDAGLEDRFVFMNAEGTGEGSRVQPGLESTANGAITFRVRNEVVQDFLDYVMSLTVARHGDIPDDWFAQFWQQSLKCKLENSTMAQDEHARVCSPSDRLSRDSVVQDDFVLQTIMATYVTAQGLLNAGNCQASPLGIAGCLREQGNERRQLIFDAVRSGSWNVLQDELRDDFTFRFTAGGYGNTGFAVFAHQKIRGEDRYEYKQIGIWTDEGLKINLADYNRVQSESDTRPVRSTCPPGVRCNCMAFNGTSVGTGGTGSISPTFLPVLGESAELHSSMRATWGIVVAALAALGIVVTLGALVYLLIFYPIKGGTSVLGFILLIAVLAMYVLVFAFLLNDVPQTCAVRRFCLGLVYALVFSCMLVKVLNTWRLGAYFIDYLPSYQRLAHPCSLVFIVLSLTMVQVIIGMEWLILKPPTVENIYTDNGMLQRCAPADFHNEELVLSCIYVMLLMLLTLIFAAITWDSEENHRESRWLLITTSFTIGIMLVWTLVSTKTAIRYREPAIAIALVVNATIILLAIFVRKIYLLSKYQKEADDERKSQAAFNNDETKEYNSTLYNNQAFDYSGETGSRKGVGSHAGSGVVYVYDGTAGNHQGIAQNTY